MNATSKPDTKPCLVGLSLDELLEIGFSPADPPICCANEFLWRNKDEYLAAYRDYYDLAEAALWDEDDPQEFGLVVEVNQRPGRRRHEPYH